jgi:DNA-directed RNA polymerase subunit alpha
MPDAQANEQSIPQQLLDGLDDINALIQLRQVQATSPARRRELESLVLELMENPTLDDQELSDEDAKLIAGVGLWALGRIEEAQAQLAEAGTHEADYFAGLCFLEAGFHQRAVDAFESAQHGKAAVKYRAALGHAEALAKSGEQEQALKDLNALAKDHEDDADIHYLIGLCHDLADERDTAIAAYEKALEHDPNHEDATFRLAFNAALRGDEQTAREHYEALLDRPEAYINALINLGCLYEDLRQFEKAIQCFRRVLRIDPNHARARLYLKDAHASLNMIYDESRQRELERQSKLLSIPVADFELSVRAKNCLQHMNIFSLKDLVSHTEEELLAGKNFGETSLDEIKELLHSRGLRLGMFREEPPEGAALEEEAAPMTPQPEQPVDESILLTPITQLDLSIRSRKCMERLGITTIGQLIDHTADELLASRNFGQTSLDEVQQKLANYGLALKEPEPEPEDEEGEQAPEDAEEALEEPPEDQEDDAAADEQAEDSAPEDEGDDEEDAQ